MPTRVGLCASSSGEANPVTAGGCGGHTEGRNGALVDSERAIMRSRPVGSGHWHEKLGAIWFRLLAKHSFICKLANKLDADG